MSEYLSEMLWIFSVISLLFFFIRLFSPNTKRSAARTSSWYKVMRDKKIAYQPANQPTGNRKSTYPRIYLQVPFSEKDIAKAHGARWDPKKKLWYVPAQASWDDFQRWPRIDDKVEILANEAQIVTTDEQCYRCGKSTPVSAVLLPNGWEDRDNEYDSWQYIGTDAFLSHPTYLSLNLTKAFKTSGAKVKFSYSKKAGYKYWMNVCTRCGATQGDHYLFEMGGPFHKAYLEKSQPYTVSKPLDAIQAGAGIVSFC